MNQVNFFLYAHQNSGSKSVMIVEVITQQIKPVRLNSRQLCLNYALVKSMIYFRNFGVQQNH